MKRICFILSMAILVGITNAQEISRLENGMKACIGSKGYTCEITFYSPAIVRIVKYPSSMSLAPEKISLSVILTPMPTKISYKDTTEQLVMTTSAMSVIFDKKTDNISFTDMQGKELLKEKDTKFILRKEGADKGAYQTYQSFVIDTDEAIYGLGQFQNGKMNQRYISKYLTQENTEDVVPLLHSVKGYGVFWDNYSPTTFTDTNEETSFDSEVGDCVDYYFMFGGDADGVVALMRSLTGQVPMFPLWTYGYWQSRERYKSQEELLNVVEEYRRRSVPLDGIVQDWQYWGNNYLWNAMDFLNEEFPDGKKMIDDVHAMNAHIIISVWAAFGPQTLPYREMEPQGMLMNFKTWPVSGSAKWPPNMDYPSGVKAYDPYNPMARDVYWKYLNKGLFDKGIDCWWLDSTEPDHPDFTDADLEDKTYLGSFRKVRNAFPLMTVEGVYEHQRATTNDKRVFILTRSAFAGQQRYGTNIWSGDVESTWDMLRQQIPAGLNFSLTGIPHWNADIGGFFADAYNNSPSDGSGVNNPLFRELYVRWMQFGAFTPMMRSHGTEVPREIYYFGEKGEPIYDALEKIIRLRYSLLPYIYSTSWEVSKKQSTFMRALIMDFVEDKKVWDINDEYMFGKAILVAPIVHAQYTQEEPSSVRKLVDSSEENAESNVNILQVDFNEEKTTEVYLPSGTTWYDFWTNEKLEGGQEIIRASTIDIIPLYVRAGSIIPIGPEVQYATEKGWENLEMRIYPGNDGSFSLYEDEFDNYNYENGAYTEIPFTWDDHSQTLTIDTLKGNYVGMLNSREFTIKLPNGHTKTIAYNGKRLKVKF